MTFAVLYKVSPVDESAVKSIFLHLQSVTKEGSPLWQEALREVYSGAHLPGGTQPGAWEAGSASGPAEAREAPSVRSAVVLPSPSKGMTLC